MRQPSALEALRGDDCDAVVAAVEELAASGAKVSAEELASARRCLDDAEPSRQLALTRDLLLTVETAGLEALAEDLLHHDSSFVRDAAAHGIVELGSDAVPVLERLTEDGDRDTRWYAYEAIARAERPEYVDLLIEGLQDDDFSIRWVASNGLIAIGAGAVIPLLRALVDEHASPLFHNAARRIFSRVSAAPDLDADVRALVESMSHQTTVYETSLKARDILRRLGGEAT